MTFVPFNSDNIPGFANPENPFAKLLVDFDKSGLDCVEVKDLPYGFNSSVSSLRGFIQRGKLPVKLVQRQKRVFLLRNDRRVKT